MDSEFIYAHMTKTVIYTVNHIFMINVHKMCLKIVYIRTFILELYKL